MINNVLGAATALAFLAGPLVDVASAQQLSPPPAYGYRYQAPQAVDPGYYQRPGVVYEGRSAAGDPRYCIKMCEHDMNPCDPIQYKRADMRCEADMF